MSALFVKSELSSRYKRFYVAHHVTFASVCTWF